MVFVVFTIGVFFQVDKMRVKGGGKVHSFLVNIEAGDLIVDDLGEITGDLHSVTCATGRTGYNNHYGGSGKVITGVTSR